MKIYEKNRWLLKNKNLTLRYLLGQEKLRLIKKWLVEMEEKGYSYGVKKMNVEDLDEFYNLYSRFIREKENAKVHDLVALYTERINTTNEIYFWYIKDENSKLLAGGIFVAKHDIPLDSSVTITGFRAYTQDIILAKLRIWYYIEYFYYQWSLEEIQPSYLSRWRDRNAYGTLWTDIGLAIHKLQFKFLPYASWEEIQFDKKDITQETLIFANPDEEGKYQRAILYTQLSKEEIQKKYSLIEKRGIKLLVNKL